MPMAIAPRTEAQTRGHYIEMNSGKKFYPFDPRPEDVDIRDIGHHLSMRCRYGGAPNRFYSVAEHCDLLARYVEARATPGAAAVMLLHDGAEAYTPWGDMQSPAKRTLREMGLTIIGDVETAIERVIYEHFGMQLPGDGFPSWVKELDKRIVPDERRACHSKSTNVWADDSEEPLGIWQEIQMLNPREAEWAFMATAKRLGLT